MYISKMNNWTIYRLSQILAKHELFWELIGSETERKYITLSFWQTWIFDWQKFSLKIGFNKTDTLLLPIRRNRLEKDTVRKP